MVYGDLKNKLLKLAQAYNTEKMWNKEFEGTLEWSHNAIKELGKTGARLHELEEIHWLNSEKLLSMQ